MFTASSNVSLAPYAHFIGGLSGGLMSTVVCHPLDMLKIRYSANEGNALRPQYSSYWHATKSIVRSCGLKGLYQGLTPNVVGAAMSWGLYFQWYHKIKESLPFHLSSANAENFICGVVSGGSVMCFTNPIWVAKTRLCLQYENNATRKYTGLLNCLRVMYREEGLRGWYSGFLPGLLGTTHGAVQFMAYNWMKDVRCRRKGLPRDSELPTFDYVCFSGASKIAATTITFPYQVLRTRLQDHNVHNIGVWNTLRSTVAREGFSGLYKGCLMANVRQLPAAVVTFLTYENVRRWVSKH